MEQSKVYPETAIQHNKNTRTSCLANLEWRKTYAKVTFWCHILTLALKTYRHLSAVWNVLFYLKVLEFFFLSLPSQSGLRTAFCFCGVLFLVYFICRLLSVDYINVTETCLLVNICTISEWSEMTHRDIRRDNLWPL